MIELLHDLVHLLLNGFGNVGDFGFGHGMVPVSKNCVSIIHVSRRLEFGANEMLVVEALNWNVDGGYSESIPRLAGIDDGGEVEKQICALSRLGICQNSVEDFLEKFRLIDLNKQLFI